MWDSHRKRVDRFRESPVASKRIHEFGRLIVRQHDFDCVACEGWLKAEFLTQNVTVAEGELTRNAVGKPTLSL